MIGGALPAGSPLAPRPWRRAGQGRGGRRARPVGGREQRQLNRRRAGNEHRQRRGRGRVGHAAPPLRAAQISAPAPTPRPPAKAGSRSNCPARCAASPRPSACPAQQVLRQMLGLGTMANINSEIDPEMAELLAVEMGVEVDFKQRSRRWPNNGWPPCTTSPTTRPSSSPPAGRSRSWATSTTARRRCWIASSASTWSAARAAASRSTSAPTRSRRTAARSPSSIRPATRRSPKCAPAAPTSPTSPCWSWRPTTASCRRPKRRSATPGRPECRSSWP